MNRRSDRIGCSFLGVSDDLRSAVYKSTPSRHRRVATRTFPAEIVLAALHRRRSQLQQAVRFDCVVSHFGNGVLPSLGF